MIDFEDIKEYDVAIERFAAGGGIGIEFSDKECPFLPELIDAVQKTSMELRKSAVGCNCYHLIFPGGCDREKIFEKLLLFFEECKLTYKEVSNASPYRCGYSGYTTSVLSTKEGGLFSRGV